MGTKKAAGSESEAIRTFLASDFDHVGFGKLRFHAVYVTTLEISGNERRPAWIRLY
jgi:hypothetical protein